MRDYTRVFDEGGQTIRDVMIAEKVDLLAVLTARSERFKSQGTYTYLFDDGIAICEVRYGKSGNKSCAIKQIPWESITGIDFSDGRAKFITRQGNVDGGILLHDREDRGGRERISDLQLKGAIPTRVAVKLPEVKNKAKSSEATTLLGGLLIWIIILIGLPLYRGGGSLGASILPGLADIAPDSVDLAIKINPDWSLITRAKLAGMVVALETTPTEVVTTLFGIHENSIQSLWFVPVYWIEKLANRDWQVKTLASMISSSVNHPNNEVKPSN
jgi:hypothetical protein